MKVKVIDIEAGKLIAILNIKDARQLGVLPLERIKIVQKNGKEIHAPVDITDSMLAENELGLFEEVARFLNVKNDSVVTVSAAQKPHSVHSIRKKIDKSRLSTEELFEIVKDIESNRLSEIEVASFITAVQINGFDLEETVAMTQALIDTGSRIDFGEKMVLDKHSIGGTNGRATMVVVPIIAAAGYHIPKTSSRSITSAAGTADAMECLCPVTLSLEKVKKITAKTGGVIAWGGAINLAPADDKIIKIEHPLSLDPKGQVIASVMAKKASVGAKFLVIDIPVGPDTKIKNRADAEDIAYKFLEVGKRVGIKVEVILTDGSRPSGNAFGPCLEAKLALQVLEGKVFDSMAKKSLELAGSLLELAGDCRQGEGYAKAKGLLESKKALRKMQEIIRAQGGDIVSSTQVPQAQYRYTVLAENETEILHINLKSCIEIARTAGAPGDKQAGLMLRVETGQKVAKGAPLFEIHAQNKRKLALARELAKEIQVFETEKSRIEKFYFKNS